MLVTISECPSNTFSQFSESRSQILIVWSPDPLAIFFPQGEYAIVQTISLLPSKILLEIPELRSQILLLLSPDPLAKYLSKGE